MGAKRFRGLSDVAHQGGNILAICAVCPNRSVLPGRELAHYYSVRCWARDLEVVGMHLRCSRCGRRWPSIRLSAEPPNAPWRPPRSEAEWKRLTTRLRG